MLDAVLARFPESEALLMAGGGDYHPRPGRHKIKRAPRIDVHLTQNPDILKQVAPLKKKQVVVGLRRDPGPGAAARRKLEDKG